MKRKNETRNALFTSIISLLLCVSMLAGTTFAWFTDSVESGVNVINAGNLDVELYHGKNADPNDKVDNSDKLFTDFNNNLIELWEPGVVAYTNLKVANEGTLALTYQMTINFTNMNYVEEDGTRYTLADVLKVAVVEGGFTGDREAAHALDYNYTLASFGLEGVLEANETTKTYGVVIYWEPNDNAYDNLFNLNNGKTSSDNNPLHVDLGISLFATQEMYEEDSFDDTYDEDVKLEMPEIKAEAATTNAFLEALAAGKTAVLTADLALDDGDVVIPAGVTSAIDLNGNTLTLGANGGIEVTGNLIVTGTGDIDVASGEDGTYAGFQVDEGATMVLGEGVTINTPNNTIGIIVYDTLIVDGATISAEAGSHGIFTMEGGEVDIIINSGSVTGEGDAIYVGWGSEADIVIGEEAEVGKILVLSSATANVTYYGDTKPTVESDNTPTTVTYYNIWNVDTQSELNEAITAGADEIILADGEFTADLYNVSARDSLIITGQGADTKLAFSKLQVLPCQFTNLTIDNCTIERMPDKNWGHLVFGSSDNANGVYTISNCIFNGVGSQGIYINENKSGATYNIVDCVFNGDFGREGAITIQNNEDVAVNVNVNGCVFNNIPETSNEIFVHYENAGLNLTVDGKVAVANATQLAAAVAAGGDVVLVADITGNVTVTQKANVDVVIDGNGHKYTGTILINGDARATGAETLKIQNINFVSNEKVNFISAPSKVDNKYNYSHNVTVENCTFTADDYNEEVVGISVNSSYNLTITGCTATNLHSLLQAESCATTVTVNDCKVINCKSGVSLNNTKNAVVKNCEIDSVGSGGYGIRHKGEQNGYALTVENCTIKAFVPVLIRNMTGSGYTASFSGTNTLTATNSNGYQVVISGGDWDNDSSKPTDPTGSYTITGADSFTCNVDYTKN